MSQHWRPACSVDMMRQRARMLAEIRRFFADRSVLEVETPLLSHAIGTDPQLAFFTADYCAAPNRQTMFLQTSPEFAMKRLLAADSGSIYQIGKAFRNGESGRFHNPEFTMLEWYRVGFDLNSLMDEIAALIGVLFVDRPLRASHRISYQNAFIASTGLDPLRFSYDDYCAYAERNGLPEAAAICGQDHSLWLDFLFSHRVQPSFAKDSLYMIYGYPACQSSLARVNEHCEWITDRVELFIDGIELGNGYYELLDPDEQAGRFDRERVLRREMNLPLGEVDRNLIAALQSGLPECAGMAIGLDRLLMVLTKSESIDDVLCFPIRSA